MDESTTIILGYYDLYETELKIELRIDVVHMNDLYVDFQIPLPHNYPETDIGTSEAIQSLGLFKASLILINNRDTLPEIFQEAPEILEVSTDDIIVINEFSLIHKMENLYIMSEELDLFRGLGKRALCAGMRVISEHFNLNQDTSLVLLYACGGQVTQDDITKVREYNTDTVMDIYKNKYPSDANKFEDLDKLSNYEIAELLVKTQNNERLITYYERAFGLIPLDAIGSMTAMGVTLRDFMESCR